MEATLKDDISLEEQAQQRVGHLTDPQLRKLIEKQEALTWPDSAEGVFSFSYYGFIDDDNEYSNESIYEKGEAARIVLEKRRRERGQLTESEKRRLQEQREERLCQSLRSVEGSLDSLSRILSAKRVWLSQSGMDTESPTYRSTEAEIAELAGKQQDMRVRRQHLSALAQALTTA